MGSDIRRRNFTRRRSLYALWRSWISQEQLPQLDRWIAAEMKAHRGFGKADRKYYSDMLFASARWGLYAASRMMSKNERWADAAETISSPVDLIAALRKADPETFFDILEDRLDGNIPATAGISLKERLVWHGISPFFEADLLSRASMSSWDDAAIGRFLAAHDTRPPLWIRPNRPDASAVITAECGQHGFICRAEGPCIAVSGEKGIYELESRKKGLFEIQDYASAMIGVSCDVHPGMLVWDACAGGGGKTMQIAATLEGRGCVYASDVREYKLAETKSRARAAGFSNVRLLPWDGTALPSFPKEVSSRGGFHRVLVDAPCSASGTWRRNPDAKMRITAQSLSELHKLQRMILEAASGAVRKDGLLVYATCSFLPSENEEIVAGFLAANPSFSSVSGSVHGSPSADADTTFSAVLRRSGN